VIITIEIIQQTKLRVAPVALVVSIQSSSTCRARRPSRARRVERVEPCCSTSSTQPKCCDVERVESCRVKTWRAKWNLGYTLYSHCDNN